MWFLVKTSKTSMTSIRNYLKKERTTLLQLLSFVLAFSFLVGCQKEPNINFGSTYSTDNSQANLIRVDTSTVITSTVYVDSMNTAATGYNMVGAINDPVFGAISSRAFLQVAPPTSLPTPASLVFDQYDSLELIMFYKKGYPYYGDTATAQGFQVNQVDSLYQLADFQKGWFSQYTLPISPTVLGSTSTTIAPSIPFVYSGALDTLKIRLDDNLGLTLYNMAKSNSDTITKSAEWLTWFHGLCISPIAGSNAAIYGFLDSAKMRVFYHAYAAYTTESSIDFGITNKSNQFLNITKNWSGTALQNLATPTLNTQPPPSTLSSSTGNAAYVQSINGLNVKLTFPYINAIAQRPDYLSVLRAELTVRPVPGSYSTTWRLPPTLEVYYTDLNNLIGTPITGGTNGVGGVQTGNLNLDYLNPLNTTYTYDVTNFVKTQIANTSTTAAEAGIMLSMPATSNVTSFNRLVIADQSYPVNERITLSIYYISLYPHQ